MTLVQGAYGSRPRCGQDFNQPLPKLVASFEKAYEMAGFKVISKKVTEKGADLTTRFTVKDSRYTYEYQHRFQVNAAETVSWCATIVNFAEPTEHKTEERNAYLTKFEAASAKAATLVANSVK